jgi:hypothetical protein
MVDAFMIYLHTKSYTHSSVASLVFAVKWKAKYGFHLASTLLFYISQNRSLKKYAYLTKLITT